MGTGAGVCRVRNSSLVKTTPVISQWWFGEGRVCRPAGRPEVYLKDAWVPICSSGISSGAGAVICKSMGFRGALTEVAKCTSRDSCGEVPPGLSELACSGQESNVLDCPHAAGSSDVFCAPSESILVSCAGAGETQGRPVKEAAPQPVLKEGI